MMIKRSLLSVFLILCLCIPGFSANKFWVGGSGNLDGSTTTHISNTTGGAGGAVYPGTSDTLILDNLSGGGTVTFTAAASFAAFTEGTHTGVMNTNGQTVTITGACSIDGVGTRTVTFGASAISCGSWNADTTTNLTFNANTSTLTIVNANTFLGGGLTYRNVTFSANGIAIIAGANTYTALTRTNSGSYSSLQLQLNQTVTGAFTVTGANESGQRMFVRSDVVGATRTVSAGSTSLTNVDFRDIAATGAAAWTGTSIGNAGGNSGITASTPRTLFWVHSASGSLNWSNVAATSRWSLTTGGAVGQNMPLPQDTAKFDANSFPGIGKTVQSGVANLRLPTIDWTGATNSPTWSTVSVAQEFHGSVTLISGMTFTNDAQLSWMGRGAMVFTSAGKALGGALVVDAVGGSVTFADAVSSVSTFSVTSGTLSSGFSITVLSSSTASGATRTQTAGTITVTGTGTVWMASPGATVNMAGSTIKTTDASSATKTFAGGGKTFHNIWFSGAGSGAFIITGANTFDDIKIDSGRTLKLTAGTVTTFSTITNSGGFVLTSVTAAQHFLTKASGGDLSLTGVTLSWSVFAPSGHGFLDATSVNGRNNLGWVFPRTRKPNFINF